MILAELGGQGEAMLHTEGVPGEDIQMRHEADVCYDGQSFALRIPLRLDAADPFAALDHAFHAEHARIYGFATPQEATRIVNLRVTAIGRMTRPELRELPPGKGAAHACKGTRDVYFDDPRAPRAAPVLDRARLGRGDVVTGPAIIEQIDTTILIPDGARAEADRVGNLILRFPEPAAP